MSLYKQLLTLVSALFLLIFGLNFVLSVNNIRSYLEGEAEVHAQDTATSLGLSLSPYMTVETDPIIETTMKAIFDRGYYQEIKLVDVDNKILVSLSSNDEIEGVPSWFVNAFPMNAAKAESEISSGWSISGVVYVTINSGYAYLKLFEQVKYSFFYSLGAFILSVLLLQMVLRITLSSLKKIDRMALAIAKGKFETIDELPWTTETRNVTKSMNMMSRRMEGVITNLNVKLTGIGRKLQQDELTGLHKKSSFVTDLKQLAGSDIDAFIFIIKIDGLNELVKEWDSDAVDQFLKYFTQILREIPKPSEASVISVYRFFGSEFALLVKNVKTEEVEKIAKYLSTSFTEIGEKYKKPDIAHIGVVPFNPVDSVEGIILAANETYEQAHIIGQNSFYIRTNEDHAKAIADWKALVFSVIDKHQYSVRFVDPVEYFETGKTVMKEAFLDIFDKQGEAVSIGTFISIAEKFSKIVELDKGVILTVIDHIKTRQIEYTMAINISTRTIKNSTFRSWLADLIGKNKSLSQQLVFSLSAYAVAKEIEVYKEFINFVHQLNAKVMIKRFEIRSLSPENAKNLKPDYIRLARDLGHNVSSDQEKRAFIETMQEICELLDISILAENVHADIDFNCLKDIGITGISR
ncbi:MAG: EAL domain-containing protein [Methylococcaceae bacterium]|nr:EAL domain-containing protein [Methylococcaceae bacterium]